MKLFLPRKRGQHGRDPKLMIWVVLVALALFGLAMMIRSGTG